MTERDYSHRKLADKLGIKQGMRVRASGDLGDAAALGSAIRTDVDLHLQGVKSLASADSFLERVRPTLADTAAIWFVTRKKGHPNYVKQEDLMPLGKAFDLVDNKICSVDDTHSAIRFVVPKRLRTNS